MSKNKEIPLCLEDASSHPVHLNMTIWPDYTVLQLARTCIEQKVRSFIITEAKSKAVTKNSRFSHKSKHRFNIAVDSTDGFIWCNHLHSQI